MERSPNDRILQARALRRQASPPERLLWQALRQRPGGFKFRRQHPLGPFVADFYCAAARLVVEVDGSVHDMGDNPRRDAGRDLWMKSQGFSVLRFAAADVMRDAEPVVRAILSKCGRLLPLPHATHGSPPHGLRPRRG